MFRKADHSLAESLGAWLLTVVFLGLSSALAWHFNNASLFAILIVPVLVWSVYCGELFGVGSAVLCSVYGAGFIVFVLRRPSALYFYLIIAFVLLTIGFVVGKLSRLYAQVQRQERQLEDLAREATRARDAAVSANQAKNGFLSAMSHELRTPLNAILGFGQMLRSETDLSETQQSFAGEIVRAGEHLLSLVDEVLDFSRIESGRVDLSIEPIAVASVIAETTTLIRPFAEKEGVMLVENPPAHIVVLADRVRLKQVMLNLLSNAIKYNRPGGTVTIGAVAEGECAVFSVSDTGEGISQDKMADLFTQFNRLGREGGSIEGTGIGLALSKRLVDLMDGTISVESSLSSGSTFRVEMPIFEVAAGEAEVGNARPTDSATGAGAGNAQATDRATGAGAGNGEATDNAAGAENAGSEQEDAIDRSIRDTGPPRTLVLYVEDNPAGIRLMEHILSKDDRYDLITAHNGSMGLEIADLHQPQIVLVDINLPGIDGFEILRRVRSRQWGKTVPVIAISANAMKHNLQKADEAGFTAYVTKPFDIPEFMSILENATHPGPRGGASTPG